MVPKLIELRPNKELLNPKFDGYKLSVEEMNIVAKDLPKEVKVVHPPPNQYSLMCVKLFGVHNHLFSNQYQDFFNPYFINSKNAIVEIEFSGSDLEMKEVLYLPVNDQFAGGYNPSAKFVSLDTLVIADGNGSFFIISTSTWQIIFSDKPLRSQDKFYLFDARLKNSEPKELHIVLYCLEANENGEFQSYLNWLIYTEEEDTWKRKESKRLLGKGVIEYCEIEQDCQAVYILSEKSFEFEGSTTVPQETKKVENRYNWMQTQDDIVVKVPFVDDIDKKLVRVKSTRNELTISYEGINIVQGKLFKEIDPELTNYTISNDKCIEVNIYKIQKGIKWNELIENDETGTEVFSEETANTVHNRLAHLCSENEVTEGSSNVGILNQEECDLAEEILILERLDFEKNVCTHRINLDSHQFLLKFSINPELPLAIGLRHDVDGCIWQPKKDSEGFHMEHVGTLNAFGYVQASKQQKKFSLCAADFSYSVICEAARHVFIYRHRKLDSTVLKNRASGERIKNIAIQQIIALQPDQQIVGIHAAPSVLYVLTVNKIHCLKI